MQEYYVKWNSELDSFSLGSSTHGTTILLPDRAKVITPHVYICQVRAKGHELCLNWGHAFGLEGGQVVIFKSPISKTAPSNYFNQNPAKELKRVHWYTSSEPTDEELSPLYADLDDSIRQAITELHKILMPSE